MKRSIRYVIITLVILLAVSFAACKAQNTNSGNKDGQQTSATALPTPLPTPGSTKMPEIVIDQNTNVPDKKDYTIPKAKKAPAIDGKAGEGEWDGALSISLDNKNTWNPAGSLVQCQGGTFKYLWDEQGLYLLAEINDADKFAKQPEGNSGSYNGGDGVQIAIFADSTVTDGAQGKMFFFSFCPKASDGKAYVGEHFTYSDGQTGKNVPESVIASSETDSGYIVECRVDAAALARSDPKVVLEEGASFPMINVILDVNEIGTQGLFTDSAWFNAPATNVYTLGK